MLVTCEVQVVETHNRHVFVMSAVVVTPSSVWTLEQRSFIAATVDIVQPNITGSRTVEITGLHADVPDAQKRCNIVLPSCTMGRSFAA